MSKEMSASESLFWAGFSFFAAAVLGYCFYQPFHQGVNDFFYGIWEMIAYVIIFALFYVLPFLVISGTAGFFWAKASGGISRMIQEESGNVASESNYKWLVVLIPVTAIVVFLMVGFPRDTPWVKDSMDEALTVLSKAKGPNVKIKGRYEPEWPVVSGAYESFKTGLALPASSLSDQAKRPYDAGDIAMVSLLALLVGAPAIGFFLISDEEDCLRKEKREREAELTKQKESVYQEKIAGLNSKISEYADAFHRQAEKIKTLQLTQQVLEKKENAFNEIGAVESSKRGVLDTDLI